MSEFARILKFLRRREKLTQQELAKKLKISKSSISMYENGNREPDFEQLEMIADFFNVDMNFLLGIKNKNVIETACINYKYCQENDVISIIETYLKLEKADQEAVNTLIDGLSKKGKNKEEKKKDIV